MKLDNQFCRARRKEWGTPLAFGPLGCGVEGADARQTRSFNRARLPQTAFTLIELLVVIAIMGGLAALVVGLSGVSSRKLRESRVRAELTSLVSAIENYKSRTGSYPPDNTNNPALNPLFYELTGCIFTNSPAPTFMTLGSWEAIPAATYKRIFGVSGVQNSSRDPVNVPYTRFVPKPKQYAEIDDADDVEILVVPFAGPTERMLIGKRQGDSKGRVMLNPWRYDASSTNRHNRTTYDLWAEVQFGKNVITIGNWKE
jgi:prepilin-type N-terminal cleavage/methylation domain-containing protein